MKRSNQFDRTTRDIINAFLEVLGRKPFEKIVVQDILDAARINRSTFYQHFTDKYAILNYLQQKYVKEFSDIVNDLRLQEGRSFSAMDEPVREYFVRYRDTLRLLLPIKTEHIDFREGFENIYREYFREIMPTLSQLELKMLSGMAMEYFSWCLSDEETASNYTNSFFESCLKLTLAFFSLDSYPEARTELIQLIGKYRPD